MKRIIAATAIALCAVVLYGRAFAEDADKGKEVFTKYKCNNCHSVDAAQVKRLKPVSKTAAHKPPDLSSIGTQHDQAWFEKWVDKMEKVDGRVHPATKFKGTKEEKEQVAAWLATMKTEAPAGAAGEGAKGAMKEAKEAEKKASEAQHEAKEAEQKAKEAAPDTTHH